MALEVGETGLEVYRSELLESVGTEDLEVEDMVKFAEVNDIKYDEDVEITVVNSLGSSTVVLVPIPVPGSDSFPVEVDSGLGSVIVDNVAFCVVVESTTVGVDSTEVVAGFDVSVLSLTSDVFEDSDEIDVPVPENEPGKVVAGEVPVDVYLGSL